MSLSKLWTALRGATNEGLEAAVDTQAIRILDQELRDAKTELAASDQNLTKIMAKRKIADSKVKALQTDVETYTNHAIAASESGAFCSFNACFGSFRIVNKFFQSSSDRIFVVLII